MQNVVFGSPYSNGACYDTEAEVRELLGMVKKEEEEECWSDSSSVEIMEDNDDILSNINMNDLLNVNSPESAAECDLPTVLENPEFLLTPLDPMLGSCVSQTKVFFQPREVIQMDGDGGAFRGKTKPLPGDDQKPRQQHVQRKPESLPAASCSGKQLEQLPMVFAVLFMVLLCLLQLVSSSAGLPLSSTSLLVLSSLLSLGVVTAKYVSS